VAAFACSRIVHGRRWKSKAQASNLLIEERELEASGLN
jgi:hypothetical protein